MMKKKVVDHRINWPVTILLIIGCVTIFFPLYMAVIIAFKQPSEMTNDIAGALSLPSAFSFSNFTEAMRVTDFWHSLGNSLMLTIITVILTMLIHSLAGYAIGRSMARSKAYNFVYLYLVSGMFVPFAILMMPLIKQTAQMGIANRAGVVILYVVFYIPMNLLLYTGYLKNIPLALEEAARVDGSTTWHTFWRIIFPIMKPMHATVAVLTALAVWNDVMTPLVIMSGTGLNTLPLAQLNFQTQFGTNYNLAFASYLLALLPILIFYIFCQKHDPERRGKRSCEVGCKYCIQKTAGRLAVVSTCQILYAPESAAAPCISVPRRFFCIYFGKQGPAVLTNPAACPTMRYSEVEIRSGRFRTYGFVRNLKIQRKGAASNGKKGNQRRAAGAGNGRHRRI